MGSPVTAMLMILKLYFPLHFSQESVPPYFGCLEDVKLWMGISFRKLNENKTEVIILGSLDVSIVLGPLTPHRTPLLKAIEV